jgi:FdhD protein
MGSVNHVRIVKHQPSGTSEKTDLVAVEEPLEIRLGFGPADQREQRSLAVTMRTPGHDFELAAGFLFTEGIVQSFSQIENIRYCENLGKQEANNVVRVELNSSLTPDFQKLQRNFYTTSSCGVCGKSSIEAVTVQCTPVTTNWSVSARLIQSLPDKLREAQHVFEHTGGLHASGLFDPQGSLILLREDVGRHNALDKVIGAMLFKEATPLSNFILVVSGRASFELVQKAAVAGIPVLVAVGAPSSLAVNLAQTSGITLIGFAREERFNIYTHPHRIE